MKIVHTRIPHLMHNGSLPLVIISTGNTVLRCAIHINRIGKSIGHNDLSLLKGYCLQLKE